MTGAVRATPKARLASARTVPPPGLAALGLSWNGLKHNRAFDVLVGNNAVRTALDAIFSPGQWPQATIRSTAHRCPTEPGRRVVARIFG